MTSTTVPPLRKPRPAKALRSTMAALPSGLRITAVRKPGVPLVEVRLRLPLLSARAGHCARSALLAETLLTGAQGLDRAGLAASVQELGAGLHTSADPDRLLLSGNVLAPNLGRLLRLLAAVVTEPSFPRSEVATERDRLAERLTIARARPGVIAAEALARRMWGNHPYAHELAEPEQVAAVTAAQLRALHHAFVRPFDAVLTLVGDLPPARMVDLAQDALADWTGTAAPARVPALPTPLPGPLLVVDRPGSVQSSLRFAGPALPRTDPEYPALQLANLAFGGYFSSRWTENLREDKGYTYGPHSRIDHHVLGSTVVLDAEVATEVTAPAVLETRYELGRIAALPVTEAEVDSVRQYAIGTLALSTATQAGLASTLSALSASGLGLDWLASHPSRLLAATVDEVSTAAARFLAPARLSGVVVGDAARVTAPLAALEAVAG